MKTTIYCIYIMTNEWNTTYCVGFSSGLKDRIYAHKEQLVEGFTKRYNINKLVYYECGDDYNGVLAREKQVKRWSRAKKIALIKKVNPTLKDLYDKL
ncbi:MAG: GIY-YIG nuclease family protein [Patescibacteria group bacterium]